MGDGRGFGGGRLEGVELVGIELEEMSGVGGLEGLFEEGGEGGIGAALGEEVGQDQPVFGTGGGDVEEASEFGFGVDAFEIRVETGSVEAGVSGADLDFE